MGTLTLAGEPVSLRATSKDKNKTEMLEKALMEEQE